MFERIDTKFGAESDARITRCETVNFCTADTVAPSRRAVTVTWYEPGRRLFGLKSKRGPVVDVQFAPEDGAILQEKIGTERVSPKQVEKLKRVLNNITESGVNLILSSGKNWRSGTEPCVA
jgi:hypothetical protein